MPDGGSFTLPVLPKQSTKGTCMAATMRDGVDLRHSNQESFPAEALLWQCRNSRPVSSIRDVGLYYWRYSDSQGNLGDELSPYIVRKLSGKEPGYAPLDSPGKICAVGSLIDAASLKSGGIFWGTGTHHAELPTNSNRHVLSFRAVRGPVTRSLLIKHGYRCPAIYGDPALLMPGFYMPAVRKKYKLGVIPHYIHQQYLRCGDDVKFINILRNKGDIETFIDELCECESIISSSLHGLILAHSYGIPARYLQVHGIPLSGKEGIKFADYFKSVKMPIQRPVVVHPWTILSSDFVKNMDTVVDLKIDLDLLRDVFPYG